MFDLTVMPVGDRWMLLDEAEGELGAYDSKAEALTAAAGFAVVDREPRHVLIFEGADGWDEAVVEPPPVH